jgi:hypothetical protein
VRDPLAHPLFTVPQPSLSVVARGGNHITGAMDFGTAIRREGAMSYTIGFVPRSQSQISATEAPTANQAIAVIAALQQRADEIKFIRSPQEGEMGIEMLLLLAKEEAEEMPRK